MSLRAHKDDNECQPQSRLLHALNVGVNSYDDGPLAWDETKYPPGFFEETDDDAEEGEPGSRSYRIALRRDKYYLKQLAREQERSEKLWPRQSGQVTFDAHIKMQLVDGIDDILSKAIDNKWIFPFPGKSVLTREAILSGLHNKTYVFHETNGVWPYGSQERKKH